MHAQTQYGKEDPECVLRIKALYKELDLENVYKQAEEQSYVEVKCSPCFNNVLLLMMLLCSALADGHMAIQLCRVVWCAAAQGTDRGRQARTAPARPQPAPRQDLQAFRLSPLYQAGLCRAIQIKTTALK